jgi:hypothetical protein
VPGGAALPGGEEMSEADRSAIAAAMADLDAQESAAAAARSPGALIFLCFDAPYKRREHHSVVTDASLRL